MNPSARRVAILGGGLAGMSAAAALAQAGYRVNLVEKRSALGGRAGSHLDAATGEWIDNCQHVLMPCCTNLLDFYSRIGVREKIRFYPEIPFIDEKGCLSVLRSSFLPAPFHCSQSFLSLQFLSPSEKLRITCGLAALLALGKRSTQLDLTALDWFRAHWQSNRTIRSFWQLVLVSALNETLDRASLRYAAKVFLEAFLSHPQGWWLGLPTVPLSSLYGDPLVRLLEARQGQVRLQEEVQGLVVKDGKVSAAAVAGGEEIEADAFVLALPWQAAGRLLEDANLVSGATAAAILEPSPITGIHLWFDRPVTSLDFAALPGKQVQWLFNKTRTFDIEAAHGSYLQLVTSASRAWMDLGKSEILAIALQELGEALPASKGATLLKSNVLKEPMATFSPTPDCDRQRPQASTTLPNLFLAGDWIQTGWPATMEGAVRGGYLAAEALLRADGRLERILVPGLRPSGLMRLLAR